MSKQFKICLSLWFVVLAISLCCGQTFAQESVALPAVAVDAVPTQTSSVPETPSNIEMLAPPAPPAPPVPMQAEEGWVIQITPALKLKSATAVSDVPVGEQKFDVPREEEPKPSMSAEQFALAYQEIYDLIPFDRAQYNRNPTYRHDSAMEILTGNARHQTIITNQPRQASRPVLQSRRTLNPAQFGYLRPALRLNYYRYFPSLNPFLNANNLSGAF